MKKIIDYISRNAVPFFIGVLVGIILTAALFLLSYNAVLWILHKS